MAKNKTCSLCGANLDFGEKCTCIDNREMRSNEPKEYYRRFPEFGKEQKLDALSAMKTMLG